MAVNEAVKELLASRKDDKLDALHREARAKGLQLGRNTIATARRGEVGKMREETVQSLAILFRVDARKLREAIGRTPGELGPYVPDARSASLTKDQREALDRLIVTIVEQGGQQWATGTPGPEDDSDDGGVVRPFPDPRYDPDMHQAQAADELPERLKAEREDKD